MEANDTKTPIQVMNETIPNEVLLLFAVCCDADGV